MNQFGKLSEGPFFALALVTLIIACLALTRDYAVPIAIAVLIWFLINGLADGLRRLPGVGERLPRGLAQVFSALILFAALFVSARIVVQNATALGATITEADGPIVDALRTLIADFGLEDRFRPRTLIETLRLEDLIAPALTTAQGLISDAAIVILYVMFLLIDERFFPAKLNALFPDPARRARLTETIGEIAEETRAYLWLMSMLSAGVALATYAICSAVGLEGAGFWGFLAFALNFVPTIGSITAVVLPAVYGLLTLADPTQLAILIAGLAATQFIAGEVVLPRIMSDRLNLSSFVILLVLIVWGAIWGPAGMFLAIPITVILAMICAKFEGTRAIAILLSRDGRLPEE
ncbi:MAG: AI-2E family transporter [Pseudomonadota bacterium]